MIDQAYLNQLQAPPVSYDRVMMARIAVPVSPPQPVKPATNNQK